MKNIPKFLSSRHLLVAGVGLSLALGATQSHANLLASDSFDYGSAMASGSPIVYQSGANSTGFSGTWIPTSGGGGDVTWQSTGLTYTDSKGNTHGGVGGSLLVSGLAQGNAFVSRAFTEPVNSGRVYFSFLAQRIGPTTQSESFLRGGDTGTAGDYTLYPRNFGMRINNNPESVNNSSATIGQGSYHGSGRNSLDQWSVASFDSVAYAPTGSEYKSGTTEMIVGLLDFEANQITLWVNPDLDALRVRDGFVSAIDTGAGLSSWYALGLEAGSDGDPRRGAEFIFDEFRMGTTPESVAVPEPSTYAMIFGLLAGAFILYRRRK